MDTKIITFATIKGGAGKTTLTTNIAIEVARSKKTVLIVDCDHKQKSSYNWFEKREDESNIVAMEAFSIETLNKIIQTAKDNSIDYVLIDTAGTEDNIVNKAIELSDLCIIPCGSGGFDLPSQKKTIDIVKKLGKKASIVLTKCVTTSNDEKNARLVLSGLNIHVSPHVTTYLQVYKDAALLSKSVTEINTSKKATDEIKKLFDWMIQSMKKNPLKEKLTGDLHG